MLTRFRVRNFKAFADTGSIELKPLTLLSGINSAGKSSLIQSLLLLKQTLESAPSSALSPGKGAWLEQSLGDNFNDFIYGRPALGNATLTYDLTFAYQPDNVPDLYADCQRLFEDMEQPFPLGKITVEIEVTFAWGAFGHRGRPTVRVSALAIALMVGDLALVGLEISPTGTAGMYRVSQQPEKTADFLKDLDFWQLEIDGLSNFLPDSLIINLQQTLPLYPIPVLQQTLPLYTPIPVSFAKLFRNLFSTIRYDLSEQVYYLNSFREPPARIYTTGQTSSAILEPNGRNFAEVLWQLSEEPVYFVHPGLETERTSLADMTAYVLLQVLDLRQSVRVAPAAGGRAVILEVSVETLGQDLTSVTLADVGLGYNQILPVVIQGLLTPPGGLVVFEQPEIHLHPDVQAKLVQFFVGLAKAGRRVLVETHSSHMIEHLCLEIAQDDTNWLAHNAQTLFIHAPDTVHKSAHIESIEITPYGEILNWPPSFLPDVAALDEEIIRAGFAKQQKEQEPSA